jgi:hypothetical protein
MVFGRKQEASDDGTGPLKDANPPLPLEDGMFRGPLSVRQSRESTAAILK